MVALSVDLSLFRGAEEGCFSCGRGRIGGHAVLGVCVVEFVLCSSASDSLLDLG